MEGGLLEARQGNLDVARQIFKYLFEHVPLYGTTSPSSLFSFLCSAGIFLSHRCPFHFLHLLLFIVYSVIFSYDYFVGPVYIEGVQMEMKRGSYERALFIVDLGLERCPTYGPLWLLAIQVP